MTKSRRWVKRAVLPIANKIIYASRPFIDLKSTINDLTPTLINFSAEAAGPADERLLQFVKSIRPMTAANLHLTRIGGNNDGGYVMADNFAVSGVLSLGVGSNVSWDLDIAERGIPVSMFDPTIRRLPERVPGASFFRLGIGADSQSKRYLPLQELMTRAGLANESDLILKMDVEGAEWSSLKCVSSDTLNRFCQIVIEMHNLAGLLNDRDAVAILHGAELLGANHVPVHIHANNYSKLTRFDAFWFPDVIEVTYVHRNLLDRISPAIELRCDLDHPCSAELAEINLEGVLEVSV